MAPGQRWKPSVFNIRLMTDGKRLAYNGSTAHTIEMSLAQEAFFDQCLNEIEQSGHCSNEPMLQAMAALGFVVPEEDDEYRRNQIRFQNIKASTDVLRVTIAPTMACNLRCTYCFQQNLARCQFMSPEVEQGVVEFIRRKVKSSQKLVVQWFGGEPLLAFDRILQLSNTFQQICAEGGIEYYAEMLTNGTLMTSRVVDELRAMAIKAIQISLDGDAATYAQRRNIRLEYATAYHRFLLRHIKAIVEATGSVTIRVNVDRENPEAGKQVVRMFKAAGCRDTRIDFRLGFINTSRGILDCIPHDCLSGGEFTDLEADFRRFLASEGYRVYGEPELRKYPCGAPLAHSYTIDPEGRIGKCVPAIGTDESVFSRIYPDDIDRTMRETSGPGAPFSGYDPYESRSCRGCELLPVCLGSCPKMHAPGRIVMCGLKPNLAETLAFFSDEGNS
jgi:uncharacterized protein